MKDQQFYRCHLMRRIPIQFNVQTVFVRKYLLDIFPISQMQVLGIWANFIPNSDDYVQLIEPTNCTITLVDNNDQTVIDQLPYSWLPYDGDLALLQDGRQQPQDWLPWKVDNTINWERSYLTFAQTFEGIQYAEIAVLYLTQ